MNGAPNYFTGCPVWSCRDWIGTVFDRKTEPKDLLREYAKRFNAVEGNSIFYALPPLSTVERWMAESRSGFRFCPKFPKAISHDRRLVQAESETEEFLKILETLQHGNRLGSSFLQLPPSFNAHNFDTLETFLKSLPKDFNYAVEPRHVTWYDKGDNERRLDELLGNLGIDKVIFDSRPLFASEAKDSDERDAQARKPQTPIRKIALSGNPFLRLVGSNKLDANEPWIKEWAPIINKWSLEGKQPYVFLHCPNEAYAPYFARQLHQQVRKINPLFEAFPKFASDSQEVPCEEEQLDLF
jgi:uncharacterized protein YecE (DUF72 family)